VTSYELWLFLHLTAMALWIGGAFMGQIFGVLAKRSGDPARSAAFGRDLAFVATRVFMPASLVVLLSGALLVEDGNWDWSEPFIWLGLTGWLVVAGVGFGYVSREISKAGATMAAEGPSPELVARLGKLVLTARVLLLVLFVIVFLMTVKPGT
jgi:uncharacterized membrane protein